jgi:hypothetical protein
MLGMSIRIAIVAGGLVGTTVAASAEEMKAEAARQFIAGKLFSYNCFEGTSGQGRIQADGSVVGYIQIRGTGEPRFVALPAGTLRVKGDQYCASLRGLPFEPCFNVDRTSPISWRGAVSSLSFAYCNFHRRSTRVDMVHTGPLRLNTIRASASSTQSD